MTISLSDLRAKRAAMTPPDGWSIEKNHEPSGRRYFPSVRTIPKVGDGQHDRNSGRIVINYTGPDTSIESCDAQADGIVATHNAADVLIEIAEAAKRYMDAAESSDPADDLRALQAALAKVTL